MEKQLDINLLSQEAGIQPGHHDAKGVFHQVPVETKTALLQAMDLLPEGMDPKSALTELRAQNRHELLPRTLVRSEEDSSHVIPLLLNQEEIGKEIQYYLAADQGESLSRKITADTLQPGDRRKIRGGLLQRFVFELKVKLPPGYHHLTLHTASREASLNLIITPASCYLPELLQQKHRLWGTIVQPYSLNSNHNWGIGDFSDLERFIDLCADIGIEAVGLSPLHVLHMANSETGTLCAPSSRYFIDPLLVDLTRISDYSAERFQNPEFCALLSDCRQAVQVDFQKAAKLKHEGFRILYRDFRKYHLDTGSERAKEFLMFKAAGGKRFFHHAVFFALQNHFASQDPEKRSWRNWPQNLHRPDSKEVLNFVRQNRDLINLHSYILWQSELQMASCGNHSLARHLGIGLCPEITAGADPDGAETWIHPTLYSREATFGTPPDDINPQGLNWGLAPPIPWRLALSGYEPFITLLRSNMQYAGAVQMDHAIQMMRLFWIPAGGDPADGAYVHYPLQDLLGILALESRRNKCMVIARERTAGTEYFNQTLRERNIFPCAFFIAPKTDELRSPTDCPENAVTMVSSLSLPPLTGYWEGSDLERRRLEFESISKERFAEVKELREAEKKRVLIAIEDEELLPQDTSETENTQPEMTDVLNRAVHRYIARTPALLCMVRLEDIFRLSEDWACYPMGRNEGIPRLKFFPPLEEMSASSALADFAAAIASERTSHAVPHGHRSQKNRQATIPRATYRIQLNRDFTFSQAVEIVAYLAELGISHCYTSPCFAARSGSTPWV